VLSISLGGKVSGVKPEGQLGIAALRHFYLSVMPDLIRHPASPSPWAERTLLAAQTRVGWIPAQGRNDEGGDRLAYEIIVSRAA